MQEVLAKDSCRHGHAATEEAVWSAVAPVQAISCMEAPCGVALMEVQARHGRGQRRVTVETASSGRERLSLPTSPSGSR